jgi:hypothetical protein
MADSLSRAAKFDGPWRLAGQEQAVYRGAARNHDAQKRPALLKPAEHLPQREGACLAAVLDDLERVEHNDVWPRSEQVRHGLQLIGQEASRHRDALLDGLRRTRLDSSIGCSELVEAAIAWELRSELARQLLGEPDGIADIEGDAIEVEVREGHPHVLAQPRVFEHEPGHQSGLADATWPMDADRGLAVRFSPTESVCWTFRTTDWGATTPMNVRRSSSSLVLPRKTVSPAMVSNGASSLR